MADPLQTQWIGKDSHRARSFFDLPNSGPPNVTLGVWREASTGLQAPLAVRDRGRTEAAAQHARPAISWQYFTLRKSAKHPMPVAMPMDVAREIDSAGRPMRARKRPRRDTGSIGALGSRGAPESITRGFGSLIPETTKTPRINGNAGEGVCPVAAADLLDPRR
jgi:hypothetical protein